MDLIIRSPIRNNRRKMILFPLGSDKIASTVQGIFQQEEIFRFLNQIPPVKRRPSGFGITQQMRNAGHGIIFRIIMSIRQRSQISGLHRFIT